MRVSQLFMQTLREAPAQTDLPGYQLLVRGSFVRSPAPGCHAFLPLGVRVRRRVEDGIRNLAEALGGQEVDLPGSQPAELGVIQSYRQLPAVLYHIWQPPQDAIHPTWGLFGSRETRVADLYSLHATDADLDDLCARTLEAFSAFAGACGPPLLRVVLDVNESGRAMAHGLVWPSQIGDRVFVECRACGYACDQSTATAAWIAPPAEEMAAVQEVETPNCKTIADLCNFLGVAPARTAKAMFLVADAERFVFAVLRGDTELNEARLKRVLSAQTIRPATEDEIRAAGAEPGYGSPVGLPGLTVVADALAARSPNLVAGANRPGYHLLNVNCSRDYQASLVADIALARDGDSCPQCGAPLLVGRGIEIALVTRLWDNASGSVNLLYLDQAGAARPVLMGRSRFYMDRWLAIVAETCRDEHGLIWPRSLTPYDVYLMTLGKRSPMLDEAADKLYADLMAAGAAVLFDDRDERAGVKFNDADLLGIPVRIVVGERGLNNGTVEVKRRGASEVVAVPIGDVGQMTNGK